MATALPRDGRLALPPGVIRRLRDRRHSKPRASCAGRPDVGDTGTEPATEGPFGYYGLWDTWTSVRYGEKQGNKPKMHEKHPQALPN